MSTPKQEQNTVASGKKSFDPRARLVSVLGEQLIRNETVGILELVKNSYDADAKLVQVRIIGTKHADTTQIVVLDDGCGMDKATVLGRWFEPATGEKEREKERKQRTSTFHRLPLGEKGVGRFAAHRLGRRLLLVSRPENSSTEMVVTVNWDDFDEAEKYLREVGVDWEERAPTYFKGEKHGTYLKMDHARTLWTEADVRALSTSLQRLMSPLRAPKDFRITLDCPDYPKYEDLDPGDLLKRSHAEFHGVVDEAGKLEYEYKFHVPGYPSRSESGGLDLGTYAEVKPGRKTPTPKVLKAHAPEVTRSYTCGPFFLSLYIWHRTAGILQLTGASKKDLDAAFGVSIFRDGLRMLPYGEPDDDWLSLDEERYLRPTETTGRRNIIGAVEISQEQNPNLRDKTNREGLIENSAFLDLRRLVKAAMLSVVVKEWSSDRDVIEGVQQEKRRLAPRPVLEGLVKEAETMEQVSKGPLEFAKELESAAVRGDVSPALAEKLAASLQGLYAQIPKLQQAAASSQDAMEDAVDELEHERDLLLGLAGIGLAAERFTHEFARLTREAYPILERLDRLAPQRPEFQADLAALRAIIDALTNDIKTLGPMFYVRRATKQQNLSIRAAIENAKILNLGAFKTSGVSFEVDCPKDFSVVMREGPLTQVFNNLFDNAAYWLARKSDEQDRRLKVVVDSDTREVLVTDNGPGVFPRYRDRVFRPFFTMKPEGRGLGLYIVREILAEKSAEITLLEPGQSKNAFDTGASFLIHFPEESAK